MSPEDEAIGMVVPDGFRLQEPRPPALDSSLVKRGVLVRLGVILIGELFFSQISDIFSAQFFNLPNFPVFLFPKYWDVNELDIFGSGEFYE